MNADEQLLHALKNEKNAKIQNRFVAVRLVRIAGQTTHSVGEVLGVTQRSVQMWIERFDKFGIKGLRDLPRSGRPPKIPHEKILQIARNLCSENNLNPKKLQSSIYAKLKKHYSL